MNSKTLKQFSALALSLGFATVALAGPERPFPAAVASSPAPASQTVNLHSPAPRTVAVDTTATIPAKPVTTATTHARQSPL